MTIKEKARAYDEAIDKVAYFIKKHIGLGCMIHPNSSEAKELFNIFPELKESEDERIRKELLRFIECSIHDEQSEQRKAYIAWLEKQKPVEWSEKDESMYTRCIGILGKCYMKELPQKVEEELEWLKSLSERLK